MKSKNYDITKLALSANKLSSDKETIEKLKATNAPLVLWGAAKLAKFIYRIVDKNGISIAAVFTDNPEKDAVFNGISVSSFEDITAKFGTFNIMIAHGEQELADKHKGHLQVENVYTIFDFPCHGFSFSEKFLNDNSNDLNNLWDSLSDSLSKDSLEAYVTSRASNNWEYIRPFVRDNQYFPEFMPLTDNEVVVDCGAYTGDTLLDFARLTDGKFQHYYALEPSPINAKTLEGIALRDNLNNVEIIQKGAWHEHGYFSFVEDTDTSHLGVSQDSGSENTIETDRIDEMCKSNATFIKMDIEGAELMALQGASETIRSNRPKLAIAVYHRTDDLITIPTLLREYCPDYKLYFRIHTKLGTDAVLYAI